MQGARGIEYTGSPSTAHGECDGGRFGWPARLRADRRTRDENVTKRGKENESPSGREHAQIKPPCVRKVADFATRRSSSSASTPVDGRRHEVNLWRKSWIDRKPNFVRLLRTGTIISLRAGLAARGSRRSGMRLVPGDCSAPLARNGAARRAVSPALSCTTRGLSCPAAYAPGGGLLPRLFTLTAAPCDAVAVCFL